MSIIKTDFLFNKLKNELFFYTPNLHTNVLEEIFFYSANISIIKNRNEIIIQGANSNTNPDLEYFFKYINSQDNLQINDLSLFTKYLQMFMKQDFEDIKFTKKICNHDFKNKIISSKTIIFFNSYINNETLKLLSLFNNVEKIVFKNCEIKQDCNFSTLSNLNIELENCCIKSFTVFTNVSNEININNCHIERIGFGVFYGKILKISNTNIELLFLNWNFPNLQKLFYKNDNLIKNELNFITHSAKNLVQLEIQGHLTSLNFFKLLKKNINLSISGDEYQENPFIEFKQHEYKTLCNSFPKAIVKKYIAPNNNVLIISFFSNNRLHDSILVPIFNNNIEEKQYPFISLDSCLNVSSKKENQIITYPYDTNCDYDLNNYQINDDPKPNLSSIINFDNIANNLKYIIKNYKNTEFETILKILSTLTRIPYNTLSSIKILKIVCERLKEDLETYYILENLIKIEETKLEIKAEYTKVINEFADFIIQNLELFNYKEKKFLMVTFYYLIINNLNLNQSQYIKLPGEITQEINLNPNFYNDLSSQFQNTIDSKLNNKFSLFKEKTLLLTKKYEELVTKSIIENNNTRK